MKKSPLIVLLALTLCSIAQAVKAQDDPEVKKEIEAQYQRLIEAHDRRDLKSVLALKTSDFHAIFPDGRIGDSKVMAEYSRQFLESNQPPYNIRFTIQKLDVSENKLIAIAEVLQEATRYRQIEGQRRRVDTSVYQRETWSKTAEGWKLKYVDNVRDAKRFIDGKLVFSDEVKKALEAQYAKIADANRRKDLGALLALRTPDFSAKFANGEIRNSKDMADYSRAMIEQIQLPIDVSNTIETLTVSGNEAVVVVHQKFSRMQTKAGQLRKVATEARQRETWVSTPEGWKLKYVDDVQPGAWYVDGKRVDPSKPYDPNAPPYDPTAKPRI
ncbi:MAG: nuclear transport factor 2 family protein [Acidobacteriota bacterium]